MLCLVRVSAHFGLVRFCLVILKLYIKSQLAKLPNQTKPYETEPNELKLLPDIEKQISGNFYPRKFFDIKNRIKKYQFFRMVSKTRHIFAHFLFSVENKLKSSKVA